MGGTLWARAWFLRTSVRALSRGLAPLRDVQFPGRSPGARNAALLPDDHGGPAGAVRGWKGSPTPADRSRTKNAGSHVFARDQGALASRGFPLCASIGPAGARDPAGWLTAPPHWTATCVQGTGPRAGGLGMGRTSGSRGARRPTEKISLRSCPQRRLIRPGDGLVWSLCCAPPGPRQWWATPPRAGTNRGRSSFRGGAGPHH